MMGIWSAIGKLGTKVVTKVGWKGGALIGAGGFSGLLTGLSFGGGSITDGLSGLGDSFFIILAGCVGVGALYLVLKRRR